MPISDHCELEEFKSELALKEADEALESLIKAERDFQQALDTLGIAGFAATVACAGIVPATYAGGPLGAGLAIGACLGALGGTALSADQLADKISDMNKAKDDLEKAIDDAKEAQEDFKHCLEELSEELEEMEMGPIIEPAPPEEPIVPDIPDPDNPIIEPVPPEEP